MGKDKRFAERPLALVRSSCRRCLVPLGLILGFFLALGVRLPWLWEIPRFIDELREIDLAYSIYMGLAFPLHNVAHDIGALHNYILAGIFSMLGPGIYWPRLYTAVTSALTVVLIYSLGSRLYGRVAGLVAAGLLLTNGMHILVTHMAWANCTTPFFFTLALYATVRSAEQTNGSWLIGAGCCWALALQTHPSIIVFLPVVLFFGARAPGLKPLINRHSGVPRYQYLTGLAFVAGYANMIIYNLLSRGGSIRWAAQKGYALERSPGLISYVHNFDQMLVELLRTLSSTYQTEAGFMWYLMYPAFGIAVFMMGYGIYRAIRLGRALPVWMLSAGFIVIPWINGRYGFYIATRYIMPLVICALLLIGCGAGDLWRRQQRRISKPWHPPLLVGGVLGLAAISLLQLAPFYSYCRQLADTDMSNRMAFQIVEHSRRMAGIERAARPVKEKVEILIDGRVGIPNDPLPVLYRLAGLPYRVITPSKGEGDLNLRTIWLRELKSDAEIRRIMVLDDRTYRELREFLPHTRALQFKNRVLLHPKPGLTSKTVFLILLAS